MQHSWNFLSRHPGVLRGWMVGRGWKGFAWVQREEGRRGSKGKKEGSGGLLRPNEEMIHSNVELICGCQFLFHSLVFRVWGCLPPPFPGSHLFLHMPWPSTAWLSSALYGLLSTPLGSRHAEDYRKCLAAELHRPASHLLLLRSPIVPITWF